MVAALALAALVNADALVERAERKPLGADRDRALAIWHPVQDLAHVLQLHRLRDVGDWIVGDERAGSGDLVEAVARTEETTTTTTIASEVPAPPPRPQLRTPVPGDPLRIYIGGDSVVRDAGESLQRLAAEDSRLTTTLHYEISSGLSRPDYYDWPAALAADMASARPEVAIIMFGANDAQGIVEPDGTVQDDVDSPGWQAEYGRRVAGVMDALRADDRLVLWVGQPPMRSDVFDRHVQVINQVVAAAAADRPWIEFVDTSTVLGHPDGTYADRLPGIGSDLRQSDGIHLSRSGADLLARHLLALVDAEIQASDQAQAPERSRTAAS